MKFLLLFFYVFSTLAADPQQPAIGGVELIASTNGYAGNLTVRTQLNIGFPGDTGVLTLASGTNVVTVMMDSGGQFRLEPNTPDNESAFVLNVTVDHTAGPVFQLQNNGNIIFSVDSNSGWTNSGALYLNDKGKFVAVGDSLWTNNAGTIQNLAGLQITFTNGVGDNFEVSPTTLILRPNGNDTTALLPNVTDGTTPYVLATSASHSSGNLLELKDVTTNIVQITWDGTLQIDAGPNGDQNGYIVTRGNNGAAYLKASGVLEIQDSSFVPRVLLDITASNDAFHFKTISSFSATNTVMSVQSQSAGDFFAVLGEGQAKVGSSAPANSSAAGVQGTFTWDSGFLYICVSPNTWKRVAVTTF